MQSTGIQCFTCLECLYPTQPLLHGLLTSLQALHASLASLSVANSFSPLWSPFQRSFLVTSPKTQSNLSLLKCLSPFGFRLSIPLICSYFSDCSFPIPFALLLPNLKIASASGSILRPLLFFSIHTISAESSYVLFNSLPDSPLQKPSQAHHHLNMYFQAKLPWDTDSFITPLPVRHLHLDVSHPLKLNIF